MEGQGVTDIYFRRASLGEADPETGEVAHRPLFPLAVRERPVCAWRGQPTWDQLPLPAHDPDGAGCWHDG